MTHLMVLGNYLQTEDKEKAQRVARKLRAGTVYINGQGTDVGHHLEDINNLEMVVKEEFGV